MEIKSRKQIKRKPLVERKPQLTEPIFDTDRPREGKRIKAIRVALGDKDDQTMENNEVS